MVKPVEEKQEAGFKVTVTDGDGWRMWEAEQRIFGTEPFMWVDNDTVVFAGSITGWKKTRRGAGMYEWNIEKGIKLFWEKTGKYNHRYCFSDGQFSIFLRNPDFKRGAGIWSGKLQGWPGNFRKVDFPESYVKHNDKRIRFSEFRCDLLERPYATNGKYWQPLRKSDGYLELGLKRKGAPSPNIYGVEANKSWASRRTVDLINPVRIPIDGPQIKSMLISTWCTTWYEFKAAYFLYDCSAPQGVDGGAQQEINWKKSNCLPAWWLWPSGKTEELCIPFGPWVHMGGSSRVIPMKNGMAIVDVSSFANSGLYFVDGNGFRKIMTGHIDLANGRRSATISPDGCRVAFKYMINVLDRESRRIRMVDVCVNQIMKNGGQNSPTRTNFYLKTKPEKQAAYRRN
ncbi:MAG: hypothetical protein HN725_20555 [Alphaproteobacteria bacterium]|nr:hypothetical protein [Alphaproteobacteria bacterium]MBT7747691.1 hypothetical protein [Alphaproteobacteria bacterium]